MADILFTFVRATPHQLIYSFDAGVTAGTLLHSVMIGNAVAGPLLTALQAVVGLCTNTDKATIALLTGGGTVNAEVATAALTTNIQPYIGVTVPTAAKTSPALTAVRAGANGGVASSPDYVLTPDSGGVGGCTGVLYITHRWSPTT